jgi:hypothetical protein
MTHPLSPAAQAVETAVLKVASAPGFERRRIIAAAALRASVEQMPSDYPASIEQMPEDARRWYRLGFGAASNCDRSWLSAVATELEATNV